MAANDVPKRNTVCTFPAATGDDFEQWRDRYFIPLQTGWQSNDGSKFYDEDRLKNIYWFRKQRRVRT